MTVNKLMSQHSKYVVRRPPGSQEAPDRNEKFREVNMSRGDYAPTRHADFEGEVSMARQQRRTDGGQASDAHSQRTQQRGNLKNDQSDSDSEDEELVNPYYEESLRFMRGEMSQGNTKRSSRPRHQEQDLSGMSDLSRPSTADTAKYTDPRDVSGQESGLPLFGEHTLHQQEQRTVNTGEDQSSKKKPQDSIWKYGDFAVNEDMVIEDDYDVESQEETPALEVYSNYQDLLAVDLDGLDLDNGSDDDVILAMLVTLIGGRDAVINYVAVHWPQYVLRVNKERIEAERR